MVAFSIEMKPKIRLSKDEELMTLLRKATKSVETPEDKILRLLNKINKKLDKQKKSNEFTVLGVS